MGQYVDGPDTGIAPHPWTMPTKNVVPFQETNQEIRVPHTSTVGMCDNCVGVGTVICHHCNGAGNSTCHSCHGKGETWVNNERQRCHHCHSSGRVVCHMWYGKLLIFFSFGRFEFLIRYAISPATAPRASCATSAAARVAS